jgi:hypothetical protein
MDSSGVGGNRMFATAILTIGMEESSLIIGPQAYLYVDGGGLAGSDAGSVARPILSINMHRPSTCGA